MAGQVMGRVLDLRHTREINNRWLGGANKIRHPCESRGLWLGRDGPGSYLRHTREISNRWLGGANKIRHPREKLVLVLRHEGRGLWLGRDGPDPLLRLTKDHPELDEGHPHPLPSSHPPTFGAPNPFADRKRRCSPMQHLKPTSNWPLYAAIATLILSLLLIIACGDDEPSTPVATEVPTAAPAPATPAPTMAPTPTAMPATPAATPRPTPRPTPTAAPSTPRPTPTAAPTPAPTPEPTAMARVPVSPRLEISMVPPGHQVTMVHQTFHSSSGPIKTMYEEMVYIDPHSGDYTNDHVVEEWSMSDDATSWSFTLKQGIPFHTNDMGGGDELTVEDVIFSIRTSAGETSYNPGRWNIYGVADSNFNVTSDYSFDYNMDQAEPLLLGHISEGGLVAMLSKDYWDSVGGEDAYAENPVGTGPFSYIDLKIGVGLHVERVEDHWRKTPEFHELMIYYTPEDATRLAMLLTSEVHLADIPRTLLPQANERGFETVVATLPGIFMFAYFGGLYYDQPKEILAGSRKGETEPLAGGFIADNPLRNATVRKAMNLAIDRDLIIETFWGDAAVPPAPTASPPTATTSRKNGSPTPTTPTRRRPSSPRPATPTASNSPSPPPKWAASPKAPK